ncbi:hypothetical protein C7477_12431 [Phyllobacterium leguminum]|uniref:Uncharacterized protein n=1 Tax=Phyllobacterium leguminum TaxID=314237 RepID=A0A318SYG0_9HYPH|nr:hypothetical protein C7477_12431 [Phyllobacterium leguminum]
MISTKFNDKLAEAVIGRRQRVAANNPLCTGDHTYCWNACLQSRRN